MVHTEFSLKMRALFAGDDWDVYELKDGERYQFTKDELIWLDFVRGRYAIADHFDDNMEDGVYTMDKIGLSEALWMDDSSHHRYTPACLNENTALAFITWYTADNDICAYLSRHINTDYGE